MSVAGLLDGVDLRSVPLDGMIHEEVLNRIIDASPTDTPFLSAIGSSTVGNDKYEWPMERLSSPVIDAQIVDGSSARADQSTVGVRVYNYSEIRTKTIRTSTRSNELNTIGYARALVRQLNRRGLEHKRDLNATFLSNNASRAPALGVAPRTGALLAWVDGSVLDPTPADTAATTTYTTTGVTNVWDAATGTNAADNTAAGWRNAGAGGVQSRGLSATPGPLSETAIRNVANQVWINGNMPTKIHARPQIITLLSQYMFTSSARIATQIADVGEKGPRKAVGSTNEFLTDFGVTLSFIPDRQMNQVTDGADTNDVVYIYDPSCVEVAKLMGARVKVLSSDGLTENRELQEDCGLKVLDWMGIGAAYNVSTGAVIA